MEITHMTLHDGTEVDVLFSPDVGWYAQRLSDCAVTKCCPKKIELVEALHTNSVEWDVD